MRVFEGKHKKEDWGSKHNFVDENNVFVGFDSEQSCCENADWFVSDKIESKMPDPLPQLLDWENWVFDISFFEERPQLEAPDMNYNALDSGSMVVFKIKKGSEEKYLHLFNCHNGYYGHGFIMEIGGQAIRDGIL